MLNLFVLPLFLAIIPLKILISILLFLKIQILNFYNKKNDYKWLDSGPCLRDSYDVIFELFDACSIYRGSGNFLFRKKIGNGLYLNSPLMQGIFISVLNILKSRMMDEASYSLNNYVKNGYIKISDGYIDCSSESLAGFCFGYIHSSKHITANNMIEVAHCVLLNSRLYCNDFSSNMAYISSLMCGIDAYKYCNSNLPKWKLYVELYVRLYVYLDILNFIFPYDVIIGSRNHDMENILSKYSIYKCSNLINRFIIRIGIFFIWTISWTDLNGFFTGIVKRSGGFIPSSYIVRSKKHAESFSNIHGCFSSNIEQLSYMVWLWGDKK